MKKWILVAFALLFTGFVFMSCSDDSSSETGNSLPSCEIVSPADSTIYYGDQIITINVKAEDTDGNIHEVRLFIDDNGYAMDNEFPYSFSIPTDTLSANSHRITAEAEDNEGAERISSEITITIVDPITFLDPNFEEKVRATISKPTGPVFPNDVDCLTDFYGWISDIANISGIEYFLSLEYLELRNNAIIDITPLSDLTNLKTLSLSSNEIGDIDPLKNLINLQILDIQSNNISNITSLSNLTNLTNLSVSNNVISDITSLSNLTNLIELDIWGNYISDISVISNMTLLASIVASENPISDISVLSDLTNLRQLVMYDNNIADISSLTNLTNLDFVSLEYNQITDIYPLVQNTGISDGVTVRLTGNPLDSTSINTYIPQLEARGATVYF